MPVFGLHALTIPQAIGLSLMISYIANKKVATNKDATKEEKIQAVTSAVANPLVTLLIGYILHQYFM